VISERAFRYGDPATAFAEVEHRISITTRYPCNSATPIECFVASEPVKVRRPGRANKAVLAGWIARIVDLRFAMQ
jgi:hypothetical protein